MIKIEKKGNLGIDESNHGRFPEVWVDVFSPYEKDICKEKLIRVRGNHNKNLSNFLRGERIYHHLLIPDRSIKKLFGEHGIRVISLSELITNSIKERYELNSVIFDSKLRELDISNLERIIYPIKLPKLITEAYADTTYPLVNKADAIANRLSKYYGNLRRNQEGRKYIKTKIDLDFNKYMKFKSLFE